MMLDTEDKNVIFTTITVDDIRDETDAITVDFAEILDEVQGKVFSGDETVMYIVIEVQNG